MEESDTDSIPSQPVHSEEDPILREQCYALASKAADTLMNPSECPNFALHSVLGKDGWVKVRNELADTLKDNESIHDVVDLASVIINGFLGESLESEDDRYACLQRAFEALEPHATILESGDINISIHSPDLYNQIRDSNIARGETVLAAHTDARRKTTWGATLKSAAYKGFLKPETLESFVKTQRDGIPSTAQKLKEEFRSSLLVAPEEQERRTKQFWAECRNEYPPYSYTVIPQHIIDSTFNECHPSADQFWSLWSGKDWEKVADEIDGKLLSKLENAFENVIDKKSENGLSEIGSIDGLYTEVLIDPTLPAGTSGLQKGNVRFGTGAINGFYLGAGEPDPIDLTDMVDINHSRFDKE